MNKTLETDLIITKTNSANRQRFIAIPATLSGQLRNLEAI